MNVTATVWDFPEPPSLHTDDEVRAIGAPIPSADASAQADPAESGAAAHWFSVRSLILAMLHFFGAPAALYETCTHPNNERRLALDYLRTLEAMIRRILLIMAGEDQRPLEPWLPKATRGPARGQTKTGAERTEYRGLPPEKLPIRFALVPPAAAQRTTARRARTPAPMPDCLKEPLPPELDNPQTRRAERLMIADYRRDLMERKRAPVYGLVARFEALIRVYKDPLPYVMRIRQRIAAEQGRHAQLICARMLREPARLSRAMAEALSDLFWETCAAVRLLRKHHPPIVCA